MASGQLLPIGGWRGDEWINVQFSFAEGILQKCLPHCFPEGPRDTEPHLSIAVIYSSPSIPWAFLCPRLPLFSQINNLNSHFGLCFWNTRTKVCGQREKAQVPVLLLSLRRGELGPEQWPDHAVMEFYSSGGFPTVLSPPLYINTSVVLN